MLLALQLNNLLEIGAPPPSWVVASHMGGVAVSDTGVIGSIYLDDVTPVPADAFFLGGIAHASDGRRYVCSWPSSDVVFYRDTLACRADGAMVIVAAGTVADRPHGWAQTARGEVLATTSAPEIVKDGFGQLQAGNVCFEEIS